MGLDYAVLIIKCPDKLVLLYNNANLVCILQPYDGLAQ